MTKSILIKNQGLWVLVPDLGLYSKSQRKNISYLDVYALFGQREFIALFRLHGGKAGQTDRKIDDLKGAAMIELSTRLKGLVYFAKKLRAQQRYLKWHDKIKKATSWIWKVWDYKPEEIFLAYLLGYLNQFMSIKELVREEMDTSLGTRSISDDLEQQEWFHFADALRQACQHEEVPLVITKGNEIELMFKRFHKLHERHQKRFKWIAKRDRHVIGLDCKDIEDDLLKYLEDWARKHLKRIDRSEAMTVITKLRSKGKQDTMTVNLGDLMDKVVATQVGSSKQ